MALVGLESFTLADYSKRLGTKDEIAYIVEALSQDNPVLEDAMFREANGITSHRTTTRTGLPESYWRLLNRGVPRSKSETAQVDDTMGMLEAWSVIDADIVDLNDQRASFLLSEETAFLEGINQEVARGIFYGNLNTNKAAFNGLSSRYSNISTDDTESGYNVIDAGGTGATNTSAWLCTWGDYSLHMIYPKGSKVGLQRNHLGRKEVADEDGNEFMAYKSHYKWNLGLTLRDWRHVVRIANIDTSNLDTMVQNGVSTPAGLKLVRQMQLAHEHRIKQNYRGNRVWYVNRTVKAMLAIMAAEKANVNLTIETFEGKPVTNFYGTPVKVCDALLNTEERVLAA